jgi:hypothetical protein
MFGDNCHLGNNTVAKKYLPCLFVFTLVFLVCIYIYELARYLLHVCFIYFYHFAQEII